ALIHRTEQLRLTRRAGPLPGEDAEGYADRLGRLQGLFDELEREVQEQENRFLVRTQGLAENPLARARVALELGLAGKALNDVLLKSKGILFGPEGARLQLELLLLMGRVEQVRQYLDDDSLRQKPYVLG